MDKKRIEKLFTRALDECLTPEEKQEYALYVKEHPEVLAEMEGFKRLRTEMRSVLPAEVEPPYPEFFNSHLERMIREADVPAPVASGKKSWFGGFGAWLIPASAAAILAFFAGMQISPSSPQTASSANSYVLPSVYSPIASVRAEAFQDQGLGGAIIILDGLDDLPDSVDLIQTADWRPSGGAVLVSTELTF